MAGTSIPEPGAPLTSETQLPDHAPKGTRPSWFWLVFGIALVLIAICYSQAPQGEFVYDDQRQIAANPLIQQPALFAKALTSDVWAFKSGGGAQVSNYYRPTFTLLNIICYQLFELKPAGWHVVNILLHALATYLALLVLIRIGAPMWVAAGTTWIFASHPVHVESITWIAGSPDPLMVIFLFLALLLQLSSTGSYSARTFGLMTLYSFLAMGSKEVALAGIFMSAAIDWMRPATETSQPGWKRVRIAVVPFVLGAGIYLGLKTVLLSAAVGNQSNVGIGTMVLSAPSIFVFYLKQALIPFQFSSAYGMRPVTQETMSMASFYAPLLLSIAAVAGLLLISMKSRRRMFGFVTFLLPLLPALYIKLFHHEHIVRDRYLYLPIFGLFLVLFDYVAERFEALKSEKPGPSLAIPLAISAWMVFMSVQYTSIWMSEETLWADGIKNDPTSMTAHANLANAYNLKKEFFKAEPFARKAIELDSSTDMGFNLLGVALKGQGKLPEAEVELKKGLEVRQSSTVGFEHLAAIYLEQGRYNEALEMFQRQMDDPKAPKAVVLKNMTVVLQQAGQSRLALEKLEANRAILDAPLTPDTVVLWYFMGDLSLTNGKRDQAKAALNEYIKRAEPLRDPINMRAVMAAKQVVSGL